MAYTLVPNGNVPINDVPPGSGGQNFGDPKMMDNVNTWLQTNAATMGVEAAQNEIMKSFVKGLGIEHEPKALALTVPAFGMGQIKDDNLGQYNVSAASIAAAQQAQNLDKGTSV